MTDKMSKKIYALLKKRFDDLIDLYIKKSGSLSIWTPNIDQMWRDYLDEIGCLRYHSSDILDHVISNIDDYVVCLNPQSSFTGYIAVPKETAFKAVVLGEFPEISFEVAK
jgi:hypothetical protein